MIRELGLNKTKRDYGFYPLRHAYCTYRLQRGVDIFWLSKSMGVEVRMIQLYYAHIIMEMRGKELVKDGDLKDDIIMFD
jgi:site-specific recombinase XerD